MCVGLILRLSEGLKHGRLRLPRVQTADSLSGREAQELGFNEELSEEDPAEDSDGESGGSSDNHGDWTPLSEPHLCDRGERPPLRAQLSETEGAGPQDAGNGTRSRTM